jgi:hypothetical protein
MSELTPEGESQKKKNYPKLIQIFHDITNHMMKQKLNIVVAS